MSFFEVPGLFLIIAPPGSGKSTLVKFDLFNGALLKTYDYAIVFTCTPYDYSFIPRKFIFTMFNESNIARILKYQKENIHLRLLLIFDDMIGEAQFNTRLMNILVTQYRHYNVGLIITTQYVNKIPPTIRESCSKAFILKLQTENAYKVCFESFGCMFGKISTFKNYVEHNTRDHNFIVVNNRETSQNKRFTIKKIDVNSIPQSSLDF